MSVHGIFTLIDELIKVTYLEIFTLLNGQVHVVQSIHCLHTGIKHTCIIKGPPCLVVSYYVIEYLCLSKSVHHFTTTYESI